MQLLSLLWSIIGHIWTLIVTFYPIVILLLAYLLYHYGVMYLQYKNSTYGQASGISYLGIVFSRGNYGELLTYRLLERMPGLKRLLVNIYVPKADGSTTEVDVVMIAPAGIFVIESKNYSGWIYGDEKNKLWTQVLNKRSKYRFFNPIWQNKGHIAALKGMLKDVSPDLFHSYIVFSQRCTLKSINVSSSDVIVLKRNELSATLNADMRASGSRLTEEQIENIYTVLDAFARADAETKQRHIAEIKVS